MVRGLDLKVKWGATIEFSAEDDDMMIYSNINSLSLATGEGQSQRSKEVSCGVIVISQGRDDRGLWWLLRTGSSRHETIN